MKNLSAFFIAAAVVLSVSVLAGCKNQSTENTVEEPAQNSSELQQTQKELEQIKQNSTELDKYVVNLKKEINDLKIENQRLIAQTKRLEAEIIDLKLDLGRVPNATSPGEMLDKDAEPAANTTSAGTDKNAPPPDGSK
jgi:septal ring factor EnvC (AmiA/AmiB activator)